MLAVIGKIGLLSYLTPPMTDGSFPPPATLDLTVAGAAEIESECRFQEMMRPRDFFPIFPWRLPLFTNRYR
jgi:hypothetical protein